MQKQLILPCFTSLAALALVTPANAADLEPLPSNWEVYVGLHAGAVFGDGDIELDINNSSGTIGVIGALAGVNYRFDTMFVGLESDIGIGLGNFDQEDVDLSGACDWGAWCDFNGHLRGRLGVSLDSLDIFVAGGLAFANASDQSGSSEIMTGWTVGAGLEYGWTENVSLRVEFLHDEYGSRDVNGYDSKWSDNTVRAAAIFKF
jgi:outer membrane immunogenic protein